MIRLKEILKSIPEASTFHLTSTQLESVVNGVTADSREVKAGWVFVAKKGGSHDSHSFIPQVVQSGALLIIGENAKVDSAATPYLRVASAQKALAELAAVFHGSPTDSLLVIGVTGTSGKTTITYLIEAICQAAGQKVGVIGTVNFRFGGQVLASTHTTPGAVELQRLIAQMKEAGCGTIVMEVSSHALQQGRVDAVAFDAMVFSNLSPEHLDFHPDMEHYFRAKALLFTDLVDYSLSKGKSPVAVVNQEHSYGQRLISELNSQPKAGFQVRAFSTGSRFQMSVDGIKYDSEGLKFESLLTGEFNSSNISAAVTVGQSLGLSSQVIAQGVSALPGVPGRLERVPSAAGIHVWVDYAHKPDALEKVVKTLYKMRGSHRLITVFGCGGDRDRTKRPVMGRIAVEGSDHVVITSDNPRTESPDGIIAEIVKGAEGFHNYTVEPDRRKAIFAAISQAKRGDLVLIAGKGHEDYQILGTQKIHFDDREVANDALTQLSQPQGVQ